MLVRGGLRCTEREESKMQRTSAPDAQPEYSRCPACKELWIPVRVRTDQCPICDVPMVPVIPRFLRDLPGPLPRRGGRLLP